MGKAKEVNVGKKFYGVVPLVKFYGQKGAIVTCNETLSTVHTEITGKPSRFLLIYMVNLSTCENPHKWLSCF